MDAGHDGVSASANSSADHGGTLLVNWGLGLLGSLDASSNGQEGEDGSGEVHCDF
jgi:hypothetical protein